MHYYYYFCGINAADLACFHSWALWPVFSSMLPCEADGIRHGLTLGGWHLVRISLITRCKGGVVNEGADGLKPLYEVFQI